MPELPEVQVVINSLEQKILNCTFHNLQIFIPKILKNLTEDEFKQRIINAKILSISRRGKYIILNLSNDYS